MPIWRLMAISPEPTNGWASLCGSLSKTLRSRRAMATALCASIELTVATIALRRTLYPEKSSQDGC